MIDINDIAALLQVEEKLRAHGNKYANMLAAVRAKLDEHEATHTSAKQEPEESDEEETETKPERRL